MEDSSESFLSEISGTKPRDHLYDVITGVTSAIYDVRQFKMFLSISTIILSCVVCSGKKTRQKLYKVIHYKFGIREAFYSLVVSVPGLIDHTVNPSWIQEASRALEDYILLRLDLF